GAGVQHVVIIAPRGMGKTTVLLMLQFAIRDTKLAKRWQAVRFSEESYGIYDLSDFWIEALSRLAAQTDDAELLIRAEGLRGKYPDNDDLQEAGLALIKDWRREHGKRLVLLVDNFDMILGQIDDERDNARLRDVLMNDGTMMLIGGATTFFREARAYDQPLYNFFKIYNLENLRFEQMQELLRSRAEIDKIPNFEATLKANESRLRVLEYFTGGNPRLVLMLYRVVTQSDITEVRRGLEKLLDQVTPYYKSKIESLPAQQRKILDHIARVSSRTREGVRPAEIAEATRLKPNHVSAQLKRLSELGYVRAANLRERNSYYTLSEPLYAIWHQMRFGRDARQRMRWLVDFLKFWYDSEEMRTESKRLSDSFRDHITAGRLPDARNALDYQRLLMEAMEESLAKAAARESVIRSYLELQAFDTLKKEVLTADMLPNLSDETLDALCKAGCVTAEDVERAKASSPSSAEAQRKAELLASMELAITALKEGKYAEALPTFERALEIWPDAAEVWGGHGLALFALQKYQDALQSMERAIHLNPKDAAYWSLHGKSLGLLNRYEE
ncbi:MAG: tetratricopeptide repeat protein, partial [Pyrinomonadaceae bacterium]|nr:tetratricopeptide repeat protein [Pyrinomonadaceae bacterium]